MGGLKDILGISVDKTIENVGEAFDKNFTNQEEKLEAKNKIISSINELVSKIAVIQQQVILSEMNGNKLQRSWRPILMLAFGFIVFYEHFISPISGLPNSALNDNFWELLKFGMGGFVIGRSAEKIANAVTTNIDFGKKRK